MAKPPPQRNLNDAEVLLPGPVGVASGIQRLREDRSPRAIADPLGLFGGNDRGPPVVQYGINTYPGQKMSATKRARLDEAERQAKMTEATSRLNAVFDSPERQAQIAAFLAALRDQYGTQLNRQKAVQDRNLKFSMARSGLTGGSAAVDANRLLGEEFSQGILDSENRAQAAVGDLRSADEASRMGIISMIRSGLDSTTAAQRAGSAMQANAQGAQGRAMTEGLGDVFGSTAELYKRQTEAAERRRGERAAYESVYGRSAFGGGK